MRCSARSLCRNFPLKVMFITIVIFFYFGLFTMILESSYEKHFDRYIMLNISKYIQQLENNQKPDILPMNYYNYSFISNPSEKCQLNEDDSYLRLVFIVKSASGNFDKREAIRKTWGFEKRFSDVPVRTVFVLGLPPNDDMQLKINEESRTYKDIVQASFVDTYFNNSIKTMMSFKWLMKYCDNSKFYFFSDDDMYISTKNILKFLRNPLEYPQYLEVPFAGLLRTRVKDGSSKWPLGQVLDIELPSDTELYAGFVFPSSRPYRQFSSKWYVSLEEYPFSRYPPYVTAGSYVLSKNALKKFYYASFFIKHFRFDDIYLSFLAKATNIVPVHNDEFHFYKKEYSISDYKYVIASHGYGDTNELIKVWNEQKSFGNA